MKAATMKKNLAFMLALVMVLAMVPFGGLASAAPAPSVTPTMISDTGVQGNDTMPATLAQGQVWTGKSVSDIDESGTFDVTLSALGRDIETLNTNTPCNIVFVVDISGSMSNSSLNAMKNAINTSIAAAMEANYENKVAVVAFADKRETYAALNSEGTGKPADLLNSGDDTNIQAGLLKAYEILSADASSGSVPVVILMSDGEANRYTTNWQATAFSQAGNDSSFLNRDAAYYTIKTANYSRA
jgi:hypothetical protein